MRVQEILVEVDPFLRNIVSPLSSINTSIPKFDIKASGVLDKNGNKVFNVVDNNGKVVKSFNGPNAAGQAEQFRDTQNKLARNKGVKVNKDTLKAPDADADTKLGKKVDDLSKKIDDLTAQNKADIKKKEGWIKRSGKFLFNYKGVGGTITFLIASGYLSYDHISSHLAHYHFYWCKNGEQTGPGPYKEQLKLHRARINEGIFGAIMNFLTAVIAGAVGARAISAFFALIGPATWGAGWVVGGLTFLATSALILLAEKLKRQHPLWMKLSAQLGGIFVNTSTLSKLSDAQGDCSQYESIEHSKMIESQTTLQEDAKKTVTDIILKDPTLKKAFQVALKKRKKAKLKAS